MKEKDVSVRFILFLCLFASFVPSSVTGVKAFSTHSSNCVVILLRCIFSVLIQRTQAGWPWFAGFRKEYQSVIYLSVEHGVAGL